MKRVEVILAQDARHIYAVQNLSIVRAFEQKKELLPKDIHYGDALAKKLIPQQYRQRGITNLYRVELPNYWRLLYTLVDDEDTVVVFIVAILNHKDYDKLLGY